MQARNLTLALEASGPYVPEAMTLAEARAEATAYYVGEHGYRKAPALLSPPDANFKLSKSATPTYSLALAPADMAGDWNTCTWATSACRAVCVLKTGGKSVFDSVRTARVLKTRFLAEHPQAFVTLLGWELQRAVLKHERIVARLNVASDLRWERIAPTLLTLAGVGFYDYTKAPVGQRFATDGYRLTYSVSERPQSTVNALEAMRSLANAAVVFDTLRGHALPATWNGFVVIDGDLGDDRTEDPAGTVVGLRAKGSARGIAGSEDGFVKASIAS